MIRLAAFAFAKHLHFAKDAKRQWDRDTRHTDREGTHSCPVLSCGDGGGGRCAAAAVRWRCDENCAQSAVLCCESLSFCRPGSGWGMSSCRAKVIRTGSCLDWDPHSTALFLSSSRQNTDVVGGNLSLTQY